MPIGGSSGNEYGLEEGWRRDRWSTPALLPTIRGGGGLLLACHYQEQAAICSVPAMCVQQSED